MAPDRGKLLELFIFTYLPEKIAPEKIVFFFNGEFAVIIIIGNSIDFFTFDGNGSVGNREIYG